MKRLALAILAYTMTTNMAAAADSIGVAWIGKSGMANRVVSGFQEQMKEIAPELLVDIQKELPDADALTDIVNDFSTKHEGIVFLRSSGSKWLAKNRTSVPAFIGGGNHPPTLGVVENMDAPEGNVTGVTYFLDHTLVMETFVAIAPEVSRLTVITEKGHPGGPIDAEGVRAACDNLFLECSFHEVQKGEGIADIVAEAETDGFLLGNQAGLYDDETAFKSALEAAGDRPIFSLNRKPVEYGALASMAADDYKLGRMLAERVVAVVLDDKTIVETPIGRDPEPILVLNPAAAKRLGLDVPKQMLETAQLIDDSSS